VTLEEDMIDLRSERERRMQANPFAVKQTKKHKEASQIDNSTYIYEEQAFKKSMHTYAQ